MTVLATAAQGFQEATFSFVEVENSGNLLQQVKRDGVERQVHRLARIGTYGMGVSDHWDMLNWLIMMVPPERHAKKRYLRCIEMVHHAQHGSVHEPLP